MVSFLVHGSDRPRPAGCRHGFISLGNDRGMNNGAAPIAELHTILRTTGSSPDQICLLGPLRETTAAPGDVRRADFRTGPRSRWPGKRRRPQLVGRHSRRAGLA